MEDGDAELAEESEGLAVVLFEMSKELKGDTIVNLWKRTLKEIHVKLSKRIRQANTDVNKCAWLNYGELLLLQALTRVFPTSDLKHPATIPATLILGFAIAQV